MTFNGVLAFDREMTAKEAFNAAQEYKKQKPGIELAAIMEKIQSRASKGYLSCEVNYILEENVEILASQDFKLRDEEGSCVISWDFT